MTEPRRLRLRRSGTCSTCAAPLAAGVEALWDGDARVTTCLACADLAAVVEPPADLAGASAQREYERRVAKARTAAERAAADDQAWRDEITERHPVLGRVARAVRRRPRQAPESQSTKAWALGAEGERAVAARLATIEGIVVLHDRGRPGSRANIDHLACTASGVWIIDAKRWKGAVERRDGRLRVGGRDRSTAFTGLLAQVTDVRAVLGDAVPISTALCIVGAEWPWSTVLLHRPLRFGSTLVLPPGLLGRALDGTGPHDPAALAATLAAALRPA